MTAAAIPSRSSGECPLISVARADRQYHAEAEYTLFGDTIEELSWWHGFSEDRQREREKLMAQADHSWVGREPAVNPYRGVGRNDPCPCGSGRKYKKCCLH